MGFSLLTPPSWSAPAAMHTKAWPGKVLCAKLQGPALLQLPEVGAEAAAWQLTPAGASTIGATASAPGLSFAGVGRGRCVGPVERPGWTSPECHGPVSTTGLELGRRRPQGGGEELPFEPHPRDRFCWNKSTAVALMRWTT